MLDSGEKPTETVLGLIVQKPIEEHVGTNGENYKSVDQNLDVWENFVGRNMPLSFGRV